MIWLKEWLTAVISASLIAAAATALTPEGTARKTARLAGGLLVLVAVLGPIREVELEDLADALGRYRFSQVEAVETVAQESEEARKSIIERQSAAYISDKAQSLGLSEVEVTVTCRMTEEGYPAPERVFVSAQGGDESAWDALGRAITADFAVEKANQTFERTKGT